MLLWWAGPSPTRGSAWTLFSVAGMPLDVLRPCVAGMLLLKNHPAPAGYPASGVIAARLKRR